MQCGNVHFAHRKKKLQAGHPIYNSLCIRIFVLCKVWYTSTRYIKSDFGSILFTFFSKIHKKGLHLYFVKYNLLDEQFIVFKIIRVWSNTFKKLLKIQSTYKKVYQKHFLNIFYKVYIKYFKITQFKNTCVFTLQMNC